MFCNDESEDYSNAEPSLVLVGGLRMPPRFSCSAFLRRAAVMLMQLVINVVVVKKTQPSDKAGGIVANAKVA